MEVDVGTERIDSSRFMSNQLINKTDPNGFRHFEQLLAPVNITLNGSNSWDIKVRDERLFRRVLRDGTLGLGEAYMDGWWDCEQLDELVSRGLRSGLHQSIRNNWRFLLFFFFCRLFNLQSVRRAFIVGENTTISATMFSRPCLIPT